MALGVFLLKRLTAFAFVLILCQCGNALYEHYRTPDLLWIRRDLKTRFKMDPDKTPPMQPPVDDVHLVQYEGPLGPMWAYLCDPKGEGPRKRAAIIWLVDGELPGGASEKAYIEMPVEKDQTARAYREAGMVMLFPALRGMQGNPGVPGDDVWRSG